MRPFASLRVTQVWSELSLWSRVRVRRGCHEFSQRPVAVASWEQKENGAGSGLRLALCRHRSDSPVAYPSYYPVDHWRWWDTPGADQHRSAAVVGVSLPRG